VVIINLTAESRVDLQEISKTVIGLPLGIFLDGEILVAPTITEPVTADNLPIAGLGVRGAKLLAARLAPGLLPVPVEVVSEGQDAE
jgi:preprotein translocase subunit SecD